MCVFACVWLCIDRSITHVVGVLDIFLAVVPHFWSVRVYYLPISAHILLDTSPISMIFMCEILGIWLVEYLSAYSIL